jgi:hypothetical protein
MDGHHLSYIAKFKGQKGKRKKKKTLIHQTLNLLTLNSKVG